MSESINLFSTLLDLDATSDRVQTALAYAKEQLSTSLSVDTLANAAFLSPRQFRRLFREETWQSPAKAIERLRVESARLMMEAGRFSAEEIARKSGSGNRERMRRSFVRAFGQSPQNKTSLISRCEGQIHTEFTITLNSFSEQIGVAASHKSCICSSSLR
jgi:transcriptional regulator GlxA family with amidase domain